MEPPHCPVPSRSRLSALTTLRVDTDRGVGKTSGNAVRNLRQCGVPKMNYALRCTPPSCIAQQATAFDNLVLSTAKAKLLLSDDEVRQQPTVEYLRAPLRHGGFGLTSALRTSPAAYLGSVAAVGGASAFVQHAQPDCPLPSDSLLHSWLEASMDAITKESPNCQLLFPATASAFFQHIAELSTSSRKSSSLQHQLSVQATESAFKASLQRAKEKKASDEGLALARLKAVSAPRAWTWKVVAPTSRELELTDTECRMAARLNLGLRPIDGAEALPTICPLCNDQRFTTRADPWHFLSCTRLRREEITVRHDSVNRALYRCALLMGLPARLEPAGLDPDTDKRPDLLLSLPGRLIITDVSIAHPLAPGTVRARTSHSTLGCTRHMEGVKRRRYADLVARHHYQLHPFVMESCGGMGPAAERLVEIMAEAGEAHLRIWAKEDIVRELIESVAIAVQRGTAVSYLHGYEKALRTLRWGKSDTAARTA